MKKIIVYFIIILSFQLNIYSQQNELSIISWNIQHLGQTKNADEIKKMATILKDADIIVLQEVVAGFGGAGAVARLADELNRTGNKWQYAVSNPTKSPKYVLERYAIIWKYKHIKRKDRGSLIQELAPLVHREPFAMDFYWKNQQITVINYHARPYKKDPKEEIKMVLNYVKENFNNPVILAGDFNLNANHEIFDAFKNSGYTPSINDKKTTLKWKCKDGNYLNYAIDNIFFSEHFTKKEASTIDFVKSCDNLSKSRKISDHLPVYLRVGI